MAELGFMESLALGYMAAGSGPRLAETGVGVLHDLRHKQAMAQADAAYAALINEYNYVVDRHEAGVERFWRVHGHYTEWRDAAEKRKQRIEQLRADLDAANQRVAAVEVHRQALALREAEARRDATYYKERYRSVAAMSTEEARDLRHAREEIARLKAIIEASGASGS
jgi:hypothetical protein